MSNPFSARRTQRSHLLQVAEYTSTAASVVGVVVSALSQQMVYAAAPLSLSLCLNLVNRRRFEQQTEQRFNGTIAQIDQRLLHLDQRVLEQSAQSLPERVTNLSEQLTAFQQGQNEAAIGLNELRSQLSQLQARFTTTQQGQNATATGLGELQARFSQLNAQLTEIQERQAVAAASQTGLEAQFSQVRENLSQEIQDIRQQLQSLDELEALQQALPRLTEQIISLQQRQSPTATDHAELQARLSQIDMRLTAIQERQADAEISQIGLDANLSQVRENLSQEIQDTRQQIQAVALSLDGLETLQQAFSRLTEQIISLQQRQSPTATDHAELQARFSQIDMQLAAIQQYQADTATSGAQISQMRESLSQEILVIHQQLQATTLNLGEFNLDELRTRLSQLNGQLMAIQERQADAETSQIGLDANLSQVRENLSQEIQDTRQQLQSLNGLEALQQAFPRLVEQIISLQQRQSPTSTDHAELQARLSQIDMQLAAIRQRQAKAETSQTTELETEVEPPPILPSPKVEVGVLSLNLGIDFGTSFTKVCFRDVSTDRSEIVTFTDEITHLEEALLPTKIGILPDGTLITGLTASEWKPYENQVQTTVEFIKMRLANCDLPQGVGSWQLKKLPELSEDKTVENLCAYYLSRVMIRAKDWIRHNKPELIINQKIDWSANVGVPVEYCDSPAIKRFEKVLSLAWLLSNEPQTERMMIDNLRDRMKPLRAKLEGTAIDCHAIPEIAAEAWSLINSREVDEGFYVLFDVGDGTLDGSSFRYWNENGERKVDFYSTKVNSLGVTAFSQRLAQELGVAEMDVKNTICGNLTHYLDQFQTSMAWKEIQELVANVVWNGNQRYVKHGFRLTWRGFEKPLEVLIGGGGGQTSFYMQAITSTHKDFNHKNAGIPEYGVRSLPSPKDLETNGINSREFHRFAVAYGLSIPVGEQPEIRLPSQTEPDTPTHPIGG